MVHLQYHLLLEITRTVAKRSQYERLYKPSRIVANLVAARRRSLNALRDVVKRDVWLTGVGSSKIEFESYGYNMKIGEDFLKTLFIQWARKLYVLNFQNWLEDMRPEFVMILREKDEIKVLAIGRFSKNNWPVILELFPKLVSITMTPLQFIEMMQCAPEELSYLEELVFKDGEGMMEAAVEMLLVHRNKLPKLEAITYFDDSKKPVKLPKSIMTVPTLKDLEIVLNAECCTQIDFSYVDDVKKLFPGLKELRVTVESYCQYHQTRSLDDLKHVYDAFDLLQSDFFVEVRYQETFHPDFENGDEIHQFLTTKGRLTGSSSKFTVEKRYPKKLLVHKVEIINYDDQYINVYDSSFNDGLSDDSNEEFSD